MPIPINLTRYLQIESILSTEVAMRIGTAAEQGGVNVQTFREGSTRACPNIEALDGVAGAAR